LACKRSVTVAALAAIALGGCTHAPPPVLEPQADARRWPPPPAQPRVRFVGTISSEKDLHSPTNFWRKIVGEDPPARLVAPTDVAVHGDRLFVIDTDARAVHLLDLAGRQHQLIGAGRLELPSALCWADERLFVADAEAGAIFEWSPAGGLQRFDRDAPQRPAGLAFAPDKQRLFVSDLGLGTILAYDLDGHLVQTFDAGPARLGSPTHLTYHPDTGLAVADSMGGRVVRFDADGQYLGAIGSPGDAPGNLSLPKGVAVDSQGHLYVVDARFENVQVFDPQGRILMAFGSEGGGDGEFWLPAGMCIDHKDRIWVADTYNCRVQVFQYLGAGSDEPKVALNN